MAPNKCCTGLLKVVKITIVPVVGRWHDVHDGGLSTLDGGSWPSCASAHLHFKPHTAATTCSFRLVVTAPRFEVYEILLHKRVKHDL